MFRYSSQLYLQLLLLLHQLAMHIFRIERFVLCRRRISSQHTFSFQKVLLPMCAQFTVQPECQRTLWTFVCVHADVGTSVLDEIVTLGKGTIAVIAFVRFLSRMRTHVTFHMIGRIEFHVAHFAFVRLLTRMNPFVFGQRIRFGESGPAYFAKVRLDPRMR